MRDMEYTALYREWRPNTFDDIAGQDTIVQTLKNQIRTGRIGHAYLFSGPRGTGKTSTAKIFARAVNCLDQEDVNPCGKCSVCAHSLGGNTMDIIEIDAASNNGVDEIRDLRDKAKFPPAIGRYKVYIIDEVHMLSTGAFNALLKTLEEPPPHIIFILATTEPHKLPATIISRCQRYDFKLILLDTIINRLRRVTQNTGVEIEEEALYTIARWSEGGMRDALSLLDQCIGFCGNRVSNNDVLAILGTADEGFIFDMVDSILAGDGTSALRSVDKLVKDGRDISVFVRDLTAHMRNLLIMKTCNDNFAGLIDASPATLSAYEKQAKKAGTMRIFRAVEMFVELESELKWASQPRVLLELTIAKLCRPEEERSYDALLDRLETIEEKMHDIDTGDYIPQTSPTKRVQQDDVPASTQKKKGDKPTEIAKDHIVNRVVDKSDDDLSQESKKDDVQGDETQDIDLAKMWPQILKMIKKERIAIYPLLIDTELIYNGGNIASLVFPPNQGFYMAAIETQNNKKFIEDMILKASKKEVTIKCHLEGQSTSVFEKEDEEDMVVKKAIEIFGKDNVQIVDEE